MSDERCAVHDCDRRPIERYEYPYPMPDVEKAERGYCAYHAALMRRLAAESKRTREAANAAGYEMQA